MKKIILCFVLCLGVFGLMLGANLKQSSASELPKEEPQEQSEESSGGFTQEDLDEAYNQGYQSAFNDAIVQYLNDANPYILPVNMTANFVAYANNGTECWVNDFDIFSNEINHGYNIKNLYRFIHTIHKNIVRPSDVNPYIDSNSANNAWSSNGTGHLHLNFESYIPLDDFNFTITGPKKVTLYLSDNATIALNPSGYAGEIPYFNIYGIEQAGSNMKKVVRIVLEFNFYDCEKVYSKTDFETVEYASISSVKNNSEYSKGYQTGYQAGYQAGYSQGSGNKVSFWQKLSNFFNKIFDAIENAFS